MENNAALSGMYAILVVERTIGRKWEGDGCN